MIKMCQFFYRVKGKVFKGYRECTPNSEYKYFRFGTYTEGCSLCSSHRATYVANRSCPPKGVLLGSNTEGG